MAQQPGKDSIQSVAGMTGGINEGGNVAGINHGEMNRGGNRQMGNVGDGANANMGDQVGNMRASCNQGKNRAKAKDGPFQGLGMEDITSEVLVKILKERNMEDVAEKFNKECIDGSIFYDLLKTHFEEMNITGLTLTKLVNLQSRLP